MKFSAVGSANKTSDPPAKLGWKNWRKGTRVPPLLKSWSMMNSRNVRVRLESLGPWTVGMLATANRVRNINVNPLVGVEGSINSPS